MDGCNPCSDAGDSMQNNIEEVDEQDSIIRAPGTEDYGEFMEKNTQVRSEGLEQAGASRPDYSMSVEVEGFVKPGKEIDILAQCNGESKGNAEIHENVATHTSDLSMMVDKTEECSHRQDQGKDEDPDFVGELMESNGHIGQYGLEGMAADEKRDDLDDSQHFAGGLYLDELDDDVLLHIASFLEARVVKYSLSKVCVRFQGMFDNEAYWKSRILKRWPKKYPAVEPLSDFNWLDACVEREDSHRVWSDPSANTRHFMYSCNLFAEVDSVHLMKKGRLLMSGDRNRNMNVIDLGRYDHDLEGAAKDANFKDMLVHSDCSIHKGWIWCMTSVDNHLVTGSWDMYIRLFDINAQMVPFSSYKCKSAVLSLMAEENEIVASCFDKKVYFIDRRSSDVRSRNFHKQPVLSVTGNDQFIISGSEDKTISIFDRRAEKVMTRITLENYPLCMSFRDNHLWFGDKRGQLHLYDASQGLFEYVGMYDIGHTEKVTGVISTRGAIFTCSGDTTIKVHTPSQDPDLIASFDVHSKEIAWLDYSHGVLASAGGEDSIGVWLPKHWDVDTYLL